MPIYEYTCRTCEHRFEELVSGGRTLVACPHCSSEDVDKLFSTFATRSVGDDHGRAPLGQPAARAARPGRGELGELGTAVVGHRRPR